MRASNVAISVLLLGCTASAGQPTPKRSGVRDELISQLTQRVQSILDSTARVWNDAAISFSFYSPDAQVSLTSGFCDITTRTAAAPDQVFLYGSATKMYTGATVLRLVESGKLSLTDKVAPIIDPMLQRDMNTTLAGLFGARAGGVTVQHLMDMSSGLPEWDTKESRDYQNSHPSVDMAPAQLLNFAKTSTTGLCTAASGSSDCRFYSSTNFILLGYILVAKSGVESWDQLDQASILRNVSAPNTHFPVHGTASQIPGACHGYEATCGGLAGGCGAFGLDVYNMSAVNGWTCGNLATTPSDAARFAYELYSGNGRVLKKDSADIMTAQFNSLTPENGWSCKYGLATMLLDDGSNNFNRSNNLGPLWGHGGTSYGFYSTTGYNPRFDFSYSIATNEETTVFQENLAASNTNIYGVIMEILVALYPEVPPWK